MPTVLLPRVVLMRGNEDLNGKDPGAECLVHLRDPGRYFIDPTLQLPKLNLREVASPAQGTLEAVASFQALLAYGAHLSLPIWRSLP